jgi:1-deoxy-D-xylulose-5-phosphate reductoisomerase
MKKIAILGSTGSVGTQTLDVIEQNPDQFQATVLSCGSNIALLGEQIEKHRPALAVVSNEDDALEMGKKYPQTEFLYGMEGLIVAAAKTDCDTVMNSLIGMMGLMPTYCAIKAGKDIALANKETLVAGGSIIMDAVQESGVRLLPIDSEHSAIFQSLQGNDPKEVKRVILTASGGPFRGYSLDDLTNVTLAQALNHPKWKMGSKITIDSATMMNKGLEVIEAKWIFDMTPEQIEVVVHPQSIIHSMVEFRDHSIMAQLGVPDMRIPISYALTWPKRQVNNIEGVDFLKLGALSFEKPDLKTFKCLAFAYDAIKAGGSYPVVLNAANEVVVKHFLEGRIRFLEIQDTIEAVLQKHTPIYQLDLEGILEIDRKIRGELEWKA